MKFTLKLTADDYIAARWLSIKPRSMLLYLTYTVVAVYLLSLLADFISIIQGRALETRFWIKLAVGAYLSVSFLIIMPARIRRIFRQQKNLQVESIVEFTETHMLAQSEHGTMNMKWSDFLKWRRNDKMILIYQSEVLMHMLPLRCLSDGTSHTDLIRFLDSKIGKAENQK
jgi:hypothetical protein